MSVEQKIKELLTANHGKQSLTEESKENLAAAGRADTGSKAAASMSKDTSKSGAAQNTGDKTQPRQGNSKDASFTTWDEDEQNPGAKAATGISQNSLPKNKGDAKSMKVQSMESKEEKEDALAEEINISSQLNSIFGEELSEEFKQKATSIFEAAVIARVNLEIDRVVTELEEQAQTQLQEYKDVLVEKIDGYLSYVVEQWMEQNQLAVESGLRTEIAEEFMEGLKTLFMEHYIEVPDDKIDVVESLETVNQDLEAKLNEAIEENISTARELAKLKAEIILNEQTNGLADTEVEKLKKLVEGVEFESEELYSEKVRVIKENYFPKTPRSSPEQVLIEETGLNQPPQVDGAMGKYVQALSRSLKSR